MCSPSSSCDLSSPYGLDYSSCSSSSCCNNSCSSCSSSKECRCYSRINSRCTNSIYNSSSSTSCNSTIRCNKSSICRTSIRTSRPCSSSRQPCCSHRSSSLLTSPSCSDTSRAKKVSQVLITVGRVTFILLELKKARVKLRCI